VLCICEHSLLSADDLRDYFEKFGSISDATVKTDPATGRSKGFGFVVFVEPSSVDQVKFVGLRHYQPSTKNNQICSAYFSARSWEKYWHAGKYCFIEEIWVLRLIFTCFFCLCIRM